MTPSDEHPRGDSIVFVYGTLLTGEQNHHVLRGAKLLREAATPPTFTLFDFGPYPALVSGGTTAVLGEVYTVSPAALARLDRFEDHPRLYQRTPLTLACGTDAAAYLFVDRALAERCPSVGPSWRIFRARNRQG